MKKIVILCSILTLAFVHAMADGGLTLKQITGNDFRYEKLSNLNPLPDGENFLEMNAEGTKITEYSFRTGDAVSTVFDVNAVSGAKLSKIDSYIISPDGSKLLLQTNTNRIYRRSNTATYYIYEIANKRLKPLSDGGPQQAPVFSPDGNVIAFVRDNNIFLVKLLYGNSESQVTKDGKRNEIINGIPDWLYEEEFTTSRSMVFSADSKMLVWIRYDESAVKTYSIPMYKGDEPVREEYQDYPGEYVYKYPKAGFDNSKVAVYSFDIKAHQTRKMDLPLDADGYIPRLIATGDPDKVAIYTMNRHQDELNIYMANPRSTVCNLIIHDKVDKYYKEESMEMTKFTTGHILLASERDGFNHLYLYNQNGELQRKVAPANVVIRESYGYDEATGDIYYAANADGPCDCQIFVNHKNGKTEQLSRKAGWNIALFSGNFKYFIRSWSDINTPFVIEAYTNNGKFVRLINDNKELRDKLAGCSLGTREMFTFTTSEGVKLNGWMIKPANFDANKKYPVVMFQYGGPGSQEVKNAWNIGGDGNGAIFEQYLAQQGFISVCIDGRGTYGRGAEFEKQIYMRLGQLEAKDQVEGALYLGSLPYVDKGRIGIWGWSFGGFNTLMSMSEGRGVFAAGVAVAPPTNWKFYDSAYTERFMRTPKENASGYADNPITRVDKLHGALLICHGLADDNVHFQNTAEYSEALVQADKDFKEQFYVNRNHSIYGGNTRNHLFRQIANFFIQELK